MAADVVTLAGVSPKNLKDKFVFLTLQQWNSMFKLVHTTTADTLAKRLKTAQSYSESLTAPAPHPESCVTPHFHTDETSVKRNSQTQTVFDVRGDPVTKGDVLLGLRWPGEPICAVLCVRQAVLHVSKLYDYKTAVSGKYGAVPTLTNEKWKEVLDDGQWQTTQSLHNQLYSAVGFLRIVQGTGKSEPDHPDPFFLVLVRVTEAPQDTPHPIIGDGAVYFVPRHEHGQPSLMLSDLPTQQGISNMLDFCRPQSTMMQVRPQIVVIVQHIRVIFIQFCVCGAHIHVAIVYFHVKITAMLNREFTPTLLLTLQVSHTGERVASQHHSMW